MQKKSGGDAEMMHNVSTTHETDKTNETNKMRIYAV